MVAVGPLVLRSIQFLWTLIIMALIGNVIADAFAGNPSAVNYAMFVAAFSMLVVLYGLAAVFIESLAMPLVLLVLDSLAILFTFIAGVVLAAKLHVHSCSNRSYLIHNSLTNGSFNMESRCRELQASTAFFWFLFATYAASLFFDFVGSRGSGLRSRSSGITRGL
ncbi:hypothetical protein B7463_g4471, partial [Scytalidium lignicola]